MHALARQIEGVKTRDVKARLAALSPDALPDVEQAKAQQKARQVAVDERMREKARARGAKSAADLRAKQETRRRRAIDGKRQQLAMLHASERLSLHAVHKAEDGKLFNMLAGKVFALFERVPALKSVIEHLRRNPAINPAERHRIEDEALDRRHDRERRQIDRRAAALDTIEARERRGLVRDLVRQARVEDQLREAAQETTADDRRQRMMERLAEARQRPSGPRRSGPGWD